ncbi:unnamed protein product, partial [Rotaria sp. Silwood1]
ETNFKCVANLSKSIRCSLYVSKGRTNYELHPESYALRDGVA